MADTLFTDATVSVPGTSIVAAWLNDVNTNTYPILNSVAGTNTLTATGPTTLTVGYPSGVLFRFRPVNTNTGATTLNISGLGVKSVLKHSAQPLVAGDLALGIWAYVAYDGVAFQLLNPQTINLALEGGTSILPIANGGTNATTAAQALINLGATGRLINVQIFTANGTYTPTSGTNSIVVDCVGAGGAGGGTPATGAGQVCCGGGGGAGGWGRGRFTSGFTPSVAVTIGAAGVPVAGAAGGAGGNTTFGALMTSTGGGGGASTVVGAVAGVSGAVGGTATVGGNIWAATGAPGETAIASFASGVIMGAAGGSSPFGAGSRAVFANAAGQANGINVIGGAGGGGGGAIQGASLGITAGGAGAGGLIIVYEYS